MSRSPLPLWLTTNNQKVITTSSPTAEQLANMHESNIFSALGTVLGYIGAEAATDFWFATLLWPQRSFSHISILSVPKLALLMPMGGPLHKAALKTLDDLFSNGLLNGAHEGHMLKTAFFPGSEWKYTMHGNEYETHTDLIRNFFWARVLMRIPMTVLSPVSNNVSEESLEKGIHRVPRSLRAKVAVSHLTLTRATDEDKASNLPFVSEHTGRPGLQVLLTMCVTELTSICVAIGLFIIYRSPWSAMWLVPLFLRLLSAIFTLDREPLLPQSTSLDDESPCEFEIHCPQPQGNFMLLTGPPSLVLQFFRHYGHPVRNRRRENFQIIIIVLFAALFPVELLCSVVWMPLPIQYAWLCYQLYVVLAMHLNRYSAFKWHTTTEAKLAYHLKGDVNPGNGIISSDQSAVLFGQDRNKPQTIKASLVVTYHERYKDGAESMKRLLSHARELHR